MKAHTTDDILAHFLSTDLKLWVSEHVTYLKRLGCYVLEADFPGANFVIKYEILMTKVNPWADEPLCKIALQWSISAAVDFPGHSFERQVEINGDLADLRKANWPNLDDPIVKKTYEIVQVAHPITTAQVNTVQ